VHDSILPLTRRDGERLFALTVRQCFRLRKLFGVEIGTMWNRAGNPKVGKIDLRTQQKKRWNRGRRVEILY
jgi:hypothetical protein